MISLQQYEHPARRVSLSWIEDELSLTCRDVVWGRPDVVCKLQEATFQEAYREGGGNLKSIDFHLQKQRSLAPRRILDSSNGLTFEAWLHKFTACMAFAALRKARRKL